MALFVKALAYIYNEYEDYFAEVFKVFPNSIVVRRVHITTKSAMQQDNVLFSQTQRKPSSILKVRDDDSWILKPNVRCSCGKRCVVLTNMMIKNPLRRFARCRMFDSIGGRDYFEWIDDSVCDKVSSMVVSLIMSNETLLEEYQHLQRMEEETTCDKDVVKSEKGE
ncbi:hypothetical protein Cgig2_017986 [Carnegiea gigantea]|uniref:GRF-type domain-containing protein n=1 Tax=Carnegiea gigantea TaxID=171969 RepID=A0A9Q1JS21_9CARY|nr:hypothetical protein Cgig2_017986 [Carnegiea gigantea]